MDVYIQPYEWESSDIDDRTQVRIWGINPSSERVLLVINDYQPFCRLDLPTFTTSVSPDGRRIPQKIVWTHAHCKAYVDWLRRILKDDQPVSISTEERQRLYMYRGRQKSLFLKCTFKCAEHRKHCINLINKHEQSYMIPGLGVVRAHICETSISIVHQMIAEIKVGYGQWISAQGELVCGLEKISNPQTKEYHVSWKSISPVAESICKDWTAEPVVACVDIEVYASNPKVFPDKDLHDDVITMISYVIQPLYTPSKRRKILLATKGCTSIPDAEVILYDNEVQLIIGLTKLIQDTDPTIITGYNIYKFDIPYMDTRLKRYQVPWPHIGCLTDGQTSVFNQSWESSAYGKISFSILQGEGRLWIDLYLIIKRDHGRLEKYTLDYVCNHFLNKGKHDVSPKEMFAIYKRLITAQTSEEKQAADIENARVGAYCLEDSALCLELMLKLNTYIGLIELANVCNVSIMSIFTRGQQLRMENGLYIETTNEGLVINERKVQNKRFVGGTVIDPLTGRYTCTLIFDFSSLYPSLIQAYNICYTTLIPEDSNVPDEHCHVIQWTDVLPDGSTIEHRVRFIKQEIYHGILPQMCAKLVAQRKAVRKQINPNNTHVQNTTLDCRQNALKVSANSIFGALGVENGRLPLPEGAAAITAMGRICNQMCQNYIKENNIGKVVYGDTDSIMVDAEITDPRECRALGQYISDELSKTFPPPMKLEFERSLSIGFFIKKKMYAGIMSEEIDKDSSRHKVLSIEEVPFLPEYSQVGQTLYKIQYINHIEQDKHMTTYMVMPNGLDLDKYDFYAGMPVLEGGKFNLKKFLKKGIIDARRDRCQWVRRIYREVLMNIILGKPLEDTLYIVDRAVPEFMARGVPFKDVVMTAGVGVYSEKSNYPMKLFKDELLRKGTPVDVGERIDYVYVNSEDPNLNIKAGHKMRTLDQFFQNCYAEPLDTLRYIEKSLANPVEQIINIAYANQIQSSVEKNTPAIRRRKVLYTYLDDKYVHTWVRICKAKQEFINYIKQYHPHFPSQAEYLKQSLN